MKKIIIVFLLSIYMLHAYGKKNLTPHELSVTCARLTFDTDTRQYIAPSFLSGIMYKYHKGKLAYRFGIDYSSLKINGPKPRQFGGWFEIQKKKIATQIGIQNMIRQRKKIEFYDGIDLVYNYATRQGTYNYYGDFPPYGQYWIINSQQHSIGVSPLIGLNYKLSSRISFNAEMSFYIGYSSTKGSTEPNLKLNRFEMSGSPINRLGVCYRF